MKRYIKSSSNLPTLDWRTLQVGDTLLYQGDEFDGSFKYKCKVTEVDDDHAIATEPTIPMKLWIDDDTINMFKLG